MKKRQTAKLYSFYDKRKLSLAKHAHMGKSLCEHALPRFSTHFGCEVLSEALTSDGDLEGCKWYPKDNAAQSGQFQPCIQAVGRK